MSERDVFIWMLDKAEAKTNEKPVKEPSYKDVFEHKDEHTEDCPNTISERFSK